jgi:hypothetical protein
MAKDNEKFLRIFCEQNLGQIVARQCFRNTFELMKKEGKKMWRPLHLT